MGKAGSRAEKEDGSKEADFLADALGLAGSGCVGDRRARGLALFALEVLALRIRGAARNLRRAARETQPRPPPQSPTNAMRERQVRTIPNLISSQDAAP